MVHCLSLLCLWGGLSSVTGFQYRDKSVLMFSMGIVRRPLLGEEGAGLPPCLLGSSLPALCSWHLECLQGSVGRTACTSLANSFCADVTTLIFSKHLILSALYLLENPHFFSDVKISSFLRLVRMYSCRGCLLLRWILLGKKEPKTVRFMVM